MKSAAVKNKLLCTHLYKDPEFLSLQEKLDGMVARGADFRKRSKFLSAVFTEKNRKIRNFDFQSLNPTTVAADYLLPRKDLSNFTIGNWFKHIFLPILGPKLEANMFIFGLGRLFSAYNHTGVQHSTDADINIIVKDSLALASRQKIARELAILKNTLFDSFQIVLEVNPEFTLLREKEVIARLTHADPAVRNPALLFYHANKNSLRIISDEASIRENVFSHVRDLPDRLLFENFLGFGNPKISFMKLHADRIPLPILVDGGCEEVFTESVIGSGTFSAKSRALYPRKLFLSPPDWVFSMKYFVNRTYDYVCAMRHLGWELQDIGFDQVSPKLGVDPDYRFLSSAHGLMLYLQELIYLLMKSYGEQCDSSYISRSRFLRFMEIDGDKFRKDFDKIVIGGGLLLSSEESRYRTLAHKIKTRSRDRVMQGDLAELKRYPHDFHYELLSRDRSTFKICVPYTWADLGYFVFDTIAARVAGIVTGRLIPALPRLKG